jgi:Dolichyl-phosphate-mannose-protein mannosyltransferase
LQALAILFAVLFTAAVATSLGGLLLRDACQDLAVRFVSGAAVLSLWVFALGSLGLAYPLLFLASGAAVLPGLGRVSFRSRSSWPLTPKSIKYLFLSIFAAYFILYFFNAMAPESSPDGAAYHLGLVGRYLREHGFHFNADSIYAMMPGGVEMLFLFAYAFGKHSAAAMVHFAFMVALVWQVFRYGCEVASAVVGASAAVLVFASPLVGVDGTSAYNDVALAAIAFTLFQLLHRWEVHQLEAQRTPRILIAIGLVAGFAVATKYTCWLAVPYALGFVGWKSRRPDRLVNVAFVTLAAACTLAPWLLRNWIWFHNPVAPFFNQIFPNPYVMVSFEGIYRRMMATYELPSLWQIPMQVTTYGSLAGVLGPVFLLSPLALLGLRRRTCRHLLLAALVFGANYFTNIGARFLLVPMPFVALALTLVLSQVVITQVPPLAVAVAVLHAVISWPTMVTKYCRPEAWHLSKAIWREALRIRPQDPYLESHLLYYGVDRMIERSTAPASTIFTFKPIPEAYTSRRILVEYQAAANRISGAILWTAFVPEYAPTGRLRFSFPRQPLAAIRVVQTGTGDSQWTVHELRVYDGGTALAGQLARGPRWRLTARPYPWGIQSAFDNSLATFWMCGSTLQPDQFVQVDFGQPETASAVAIETVPDQRGLKLKLEGRDAAGQWKILSSEPQAGAASRPLGLRRAVAEELKRRGIDYVLAFDGDLGSDDLRENAGIYGIHQAGEYKGARLYQLP